MNVPRDHLDEVVATAGGAIKLTLLYGFPFLVFGAITLAGIYSGGAFRHL